MELAVRVKTPVIEDIDGDQADVAEDSVGVAENSAEDGVGVARDNVGTEETSGSGDEKELLAKVSGKSQQSSDFLSCIEKCCKGSMLGALLPPLLAVFSDHSTCSLSLATSLLVHLTKLGRQSAEVS